MSANKKQIGGSHYQMDIQPWDAMRAWMTAEQFEGFLLGNVIKYAARNKNNKVEDMKKAIHYAEKYIEVRRENQRVSGVPYIPEDKSFCRSEN